jgi:hypothetical protein
MRSRSALIRRARERKEVKGGERRGETDETGSKKLTPVVSSSLVSVRSRNAPVCRSNRKSRVSIMSHCLLCPVHGGKGKSKKREREERGDVR